MTPLRRHAVRAGALAALVLVAGCGGTTASSTAEPTAPEHSADHSAEPVSAEAAATDELFADVTEDDPGCTIAVGRDGEVAYAAAFGSADLDRGDAMSPDTVVDIGSVSKQFTATAIAMLAERGEVDLDAAVSAYLPGLPAWADIVSVRQLVHHTSGIPDYIDLLLDAGVEFSDPSTDADTFTVLAAAPELDFEPNTAYSYSNSNYFLLGQVVVAVTGMSLGDFLQAEVFDPLGMDAVMDPVSRIPGKATSYEFDGEEWVVADSPWQQTGDGAVQTTPSELITWASEYWDPMLADVVDTEARLLDAVETDEPGQLYGYGIIETTLEDGERVLMHSGAWSGFLSSFVVAPDAQVAVALTCAAHEMTPESDYDDLGLDVLELWLA